MAERHSKEAKEKEVETRKRLGPRLPRKKNMVQPTPDAPEHTVRLVPPERRNVKPVE